MAKEISDSGLGLICISLDSFNEEKHDYLRGIKGAYRNAMNAIEYLDKYRSNRLNIGIQTTIMRPNLDDILSLTEWVHRDDRLIVICFQAVIQPDNTPYDHCWYERDEFQLLWPNDVSYVSSIIDELIGLQKKGYRMSNPMGQLEAFKDYFEDPDRFIKKIKCNKGDHVLNIDDEGNLYLCYDMGFLGNIKDPDMDITELWYSQKANYIREKIDSCKKNCGTLINCFFEEES
jgi:MoaA/NifB/PqqE/SkfB family radical SAM enzyme